MADESLGPAMQVETLADLVRDDAALAALRAGLDRHALVRIELAAAPGPATFLALAQRLGTPRTPTVHGVKTLPGHDDLIGDFGAPARLDDGRPARPSPLERLHFDVMQDGW